MKNEDRQWLDVVRSALQTPETEAGAPRPDEKIWEAVEAGLATRARRMAVWRRTALGVAAATILGLLAIVPLMRNTDTYSPAHVPTSVAEPSAIHHLPSQPSIAESGVRQSHEAAPAPIEKRGIHKSEVTSVPVASTVPVAPAITATSEVPAVMAASECKDSVATESAAGRTTAPEEKQGRSNSQMFREALFRTREKRGANVAFRVGVGGAGSAPGSSSIYRNGILSSSPDGTYSETTPPQTVTYEHDIPLTAELSAGLAIGRRLYAGSGINYTRLNSRIITTEGDRTSSVVRQRIDLIGIPLEVRYAIVDANRLSVYVGADVMAQCCLSARHDHRSLSAPGVLWSVGGSAGVQYSLSRTVGIYAEPTLSHHFTRNDLRTIYTDHKVNFGLKFGLRFSFQKM